MPTEGFIFLMVAKGQLLYSGALAVKFALAAILLLLVHVVLNVALVEKQIIPRVNRSPVFNLILSVSAILIFLLASKVTSSLREILYSVNRSEYNIETYLLDVLQRAISLLFPLLLFILLYFRLSTPRPAISRLNLQYFINQSPYLLFFVYGLLLQVVASGIRSLFSFNIYLATSLYASIFFLSIFLVARRSRGKEGFKVFFLSIPAIVIETTGGSTYSAFEELSLYPYGIYSLLIVIPLAFQFGNRK